MTDRMMHGFPPPEAAQVTLANWRQAPFSRWGFRHAREIVPTACVAHDPHSIRPLRSASDTDLDGLTVAAPDGATLGLDDVLARTDTDGLMVLKRGALAFETYSHEFDAATPHIVFSVSKSVTGLLAGILAARGRLDPDAAISRYVPEVATSAYRDATVRHLLDMTTGIAFDEDYLATEGAIVRYRESTGWNPPSGAGPTDLRTFLVSLDETDCDHGPVFRYLSPNSDLLGWVLERAADMRLSDFMSTALWAPMGAAHDADITVDRLGAPRTAGGMCIALSDLARLGQLLLDGGAYDGTQVVPAAWIDDIRHNGDSEAWARGEFAVSMPEGMHYRSQWYVLPGDNGAFFGIGIHGQYLYLDPAREVVIVKMSSQPEPLDETKDALSLALFAAVAQAI